MYYGGRTHDSASSILHVIGRTYNPPHEYFYRRTAPAMWTPWEPVTAEIEGDHVVAVVWRDRLHLFWVTFLDRLEPVTKTGSASGQKSVVNSTVGEIAENASAMNEKNVDVSLSWAEYFQGEWTARQSSDPKYFDGSVGARRLHIQGSVHTCYQGQRRRICQNTLFLQERRRCIPLRRGG